jgi:hypothetical protein
MIKIRGCPEIIFWVTAFYSPLSVIRIVKMPCSYIFRYLDSMLTSAAVKTMHLKQRGTALVHTRLWIYFWCKLIDQG